MKDIETIIAIRHIRPNSEFVIRDGVLEWLDSKQSEPTQIEIEASWIDYQEKIEAQKAAAEIKRQAALSKLEGLGLDEDDLKALGF
jgi:hypothetical protein